MSGNKTILICQCAERGLLQDCPVEEDGCIVVPDLCKVAAEKLSVSANASADRSDLGKIASADHPVIYACHPRAVKALFEFAGHPLPDSTEFINLRSPTLPHSQTPLPSTSSSPAWYPLIDADRCTNCGQCFEFCLFGVYEKNKEGRVIVANPDACKNNCPACARICPEAAIIFPKMGEEPINGAEISDEDKLKANIKVNVDEILGNDIYAALNARKQKRRSLLDKNKIEKALAERNKCSGSSGGDAG